MQTRACGQLEHQQQKKKEEIEELVAHANDGVARSADSP
jgi:hypothetical protein